MDNTELLKQAFIAGVFWYKNNYSRAILYQSEADREINKGFQEFLDELPKEVKDVYVP